MNVKGKNAMLHYRLACSGENVQTSKMTDCEGKKLNTKEVAKVHTNTN